MAATGAHVVHIVQSPRGLTVRGGGHLRAPYRQAELPPPGASASSGGGHAGAAAHLLSQFSGSVHEEAFRQARASVHAHAGGAGGAGGAS
jgi:hypothetical protein